MTVEAPLPPRPPDIAAALGRADTDDVIRDRRVEESELDGLDLAGLPLHNLRVRDSRLRGVDLSGSALAGLDLADAVVHEGSWANAVAGQATRMPWPDVVQIAGLLAAASGIDIVD